MVWLFKNSRFPWQYGFWGVQTEIPGTFTCGQSAVQGGWHETGKNRSENHSIAMSMGSWSWSIHIKFGDFLQSMN